MKECIMQDSDIINDFTEALQLLVDLVNVEELQQAGLEPETQVLLKRIAEFQNRMLDNQSDDCDYCSYEGCACQD